MLIATSLMYSNDMYEIEKQKKAMQTWENMGGRVLSCNVKEEIELLKPIFTQTDFAELPRSGKEVTGKPFPFIYDMLQVLAANTTEDNEICGIVNSDIFINNLPQEAITKYLSENENTVLILHRYDIEDEKDNAGEYYFSGIDAFFFLSGYLSVFDDKGFMMGRPEWDHWFLGEAVKSGMKVKEIKNKIAFHIKHKQRWSASESNQMAKNKSKIATSFDEDYYYDTNEIMADLTNRICLKDNILQERETAVVSEGAFYEDIDRETILTWEKQKYVPLQEFESMGVMYVKNNKAYRICALHREVSITSAGEIALGDIFANERGKGVILKYVDFKSLDFAKDLGRTYIYPAGRAARLLLDCMNAYEIPVLGMIDRDTSLCGTMCQGCKIKSLEALKATDEYDNVIIATNLYVREIYDSLKKFVDEDKLIVL